MTCFDDTFVAAVHVDTILNAIRRRDAGVLAHRAIDKHVLAGLMLTLNVHHLPANVYERVRELERRITSLPEREQKQLAVALERDRSLVPWRALPGPQTQLVEMMREVDLVLAAGAAGSSKTDGAIGGVLLNASSVRFARGTVGELSAILQRIATITSDIENRNRSEQRWEIPKPWGYREQGIVVNWVGLSDEGQALKVQGRPVTTLVADDAASGWLSSTQLEFVRQWLRATTTERVSTVLTANPPTSRDSLYLRDELFAPWLSPDYAGTPAHSGEVRWFVRGEEVPAGTPKAESRTVITSLTSDNPFYVRSGYADRLANIADDVLRKRLALNDWSAGFDDDDAMQVIPSSLVDAAMLRWTPTPPSSLSTLGVDVARGGPDRSTVVRRHGPHWFSGPLIVPGKDTPDGQTLAALVLGQYQRGAVVRIDVGGVGSSPFDFLREKVPTGPVNFSAGVEALDATQSFGFSNMRSYLWWHFRELLQAGGIALPPDQDLKRELCAPHFFLRSGKLYVESRDEIIKRIGRSPDIATAYVLAAIENDSAIGGGTAQSDLLRSLARANQRWEDGHGSN